MQRDFDVESWRSIRRVNLLTSREFIEACVRCGQANSPKRPTREPVFMIMYPARAAKMKSITRGSLDSALQ